MSEMSENEKLAEEIFAEIKKIFSDGKEKTCGNIVFVGCEKYLTIEFAKNEAIFGNTRLLIYRHNLGRVVAKHNSTDIRPVFWLWANNDRIQVKLDQYSVTHNRTLAKMLALISKRVAE